MGLPKQIGVKKDEDFCKQCVTAIAGMVGAVSYQKQKDRFCYDLYAGIMNEQDYNYLTKVDKYEYPAKLRFIPLIRPQLDYLRSEEARRPLNMRVFTTDQVSIEKKQNEILRLITTTMHANFSRRFMELQMQINKIRSSLQPPQQPQQGQQPQQQSPEQMQKMEQMQLQMAIPNDMFNRTAIFTQNDIDTIEKYMKYDYRDMVEEIMDRGMEYLIQKYSIKDIFISGFEDKLVTDKEIYFVDYSGKDEDPTFRKVDIINLYYSGDDEVEWIDECEWACELRFMTIPQIHDEFGDEISDEDYEKLERESRTYMGITNQYSSNWNAMTDRYMIDNSTDNRRNVLYAGTEDYANKVKVQYCYWQSPEKVKIKETPNKYMEDTPFTHIMKDGDVVRKDDTVKEKYKNDIYQGVLINDTVYCCLGKKPVQMRGVDRPGQVGLPYVGLAYNNYSRRPYSLMWATREIQLLYNIIHYHRELWFALSGVKGFIMDKSQIPDGMSMKEWTYQRKLGIAWIQTVREGRMQSSFNQFQTFDDTITPAIQYIDNLLAGLEDLARSITGVPRQRTGDIKVTERVGNVENSIQQSAIITEVQYYSHDRVKRRALTKLANCCKKAWKKGKRAQYITGLFAQKILNIPDGILDEVDMEVFVGSAYKDEQSIKELRQVALNDHAKGMVNLGQLSKLYSIDSLRDLEHTLEKYGEVAEQKALMANQKNQDFQVQLKQLDEKARIMAEEVKNKYEQGWLEIEKAKLDIERQKVTGELAIKDKKVDADANTHANKQANDRDTKMAMVDSKNKQTDSEARLREMELQIQHLKNIVDAEKEKKESA